MSTSEAVTRPLADPDVYPYFVLRHMPTVYSRGRPNVPAKHRQADGRLTTEGREAVIEYVAGLSARHHKSCCAVFGPDDAVYCESDGSRRPNNPGDAVPDGYTHIRLPVREPDEQPGPTWRDFFARWDRPSNIWAVRGDIWPVLNRLSDLGIPRATALGGFPGGAGGTDVSAWPFLDGGVHRATRDGFVCGSVSGVKIVGERAFVWLCHILGVAPPRTCGSFAADTLGAQLTLQAAHPEALEDAGKKLARAKTWTQLRDVAAELARAFDEQRR